MERRTDERRNKRAKRAHALISLGFVAALCAIVFTVWFSGVQAQGGAMAPVIQNGDVLLVDRLAHYVWGTDRGELVALDLEGGAIEIRRVVALGGERVNIFEGRVYIDGIFLDEGKYASGVLGDREEFTVPKGSVFVLPDVRGEQSGEVVPVQSLAGRVFARVSPFGAAALFAA
ncbi:MAG: signal peptidase I [Bacillota bacterium]